LGITLFAPNYCIQANHVKGGQPKGDQNNCYFLMDVVVLINAKFTLTNIPPGCFAGEDEIIILNHGCRKFSDISNVVNGKSILSLSSTNNENQTMFYSKLKSWIHFDPKAIVNFLFIQLEDSHFLHITADHLIYKTGYNDAMNLTRAANVRVGDHLYVKYGDSVQKKKVIKIQQKQALDRLTQKTKNYDVLIKSVNKYSFMLLLCITKM
uniref:Hint domain-containing protein n=1 Tax=Romanomermis culicivorax TaxID=13658 RepID=A0A915I4L0_ROMCU